MAINEVRRATTEDGATIAYEVKSKADDGVPILGLHGVLVGTSNWVHQSLRLPQFRWILPWFRGHGESDDLPDGTTPTIEQAADDMIAVLDAEGIDQIMVVGNSLGGTVAVALGLLHPERVRGLVLAEPSIPSLLPDGGGDRLTRSADQARTLMEEGRIDDALDIFLRPRIGEDWPKKIGGRRLDEWRHNVQSTPLWFDAVMNFLPGPGPLAGMEPPTLILFGENTQSVYRDLTFAVAEIVTSARLIEVPNAGHGSPVDNPDGFNEILLDFLDEIGVAEKASAQGSS